MEEAPAADYTVDVAVSKSAAAEHLVEAAEGTDSVEEAALAE